MKIILVTVVVVCAIIGGSFCAGYMHANQSNKIDHISKELREDQTKILQKTLDIEDRIDIVDAKIDRIENKLDILVKIATAPKSFEIDCK